MKKMMLSLATIPTMTLAACGGTNSTVEPISNYYFGAGPSFSPTNLNTGEQASKYNVLETIIKLNNNKIEYNYRESVGFLSVSDAGVTLPESAKARANLVEFTAEKIKEEYALKEKTIFDNDLKNWLIATNVVADEAAFGAGSQSDYNGWRDSFLADTSTIDTSFTNAWTAFAEPRFPKNASNKFLWNSGESLVEIYDLVSIANDKLDLIKDNDGKAVGFVGKSNSHNTKWTDVRKATVAYMDTKYGTCDLVKNITNDKLQEYSRKKDWTDNTVAGATYWQVGLNVAAMIKSAKDICLK